MISTLKTRTKAALPRNFRAWARRTFDSIFEDSTVDLVRLGSASQWTISERHLRDWSSDVVIISGGAGKDITFEVDCIRRKGARVVLYDPSPVGASTVKQTLSESIQQGDPLEARLKFFPLALSNRNQSTPAYMNHDPSQGEWLSAVPLPGSVATQMESVSLSEHLSIQGISRPSLIKLDIEGAEYDVIEDLLGSNIVAGQICVEFHHFFEDISVLRTMKALRDLHSAGYRVCHKTMHDFTLVNRQWS